VLTEIIFCRTRQQQGNFGSANSILWLYFGNNYGPYSENITWARTFGWDD